jgi:hypothetical protein
MANKNEYGAVVTHNEWIHDIMTDSQYDEEKQLIRKNSDGTYNIYPDKYKKEYDQIAYDNFSKPGGTVAKCCVTLKITKPTFANWVKRHPSFKIAVATGGLVGEDSFRDQIQSAAFKPGKDVNNKLICVIAKNLYNISDNEPPQIVINTGEQSVLIEGEESAALYADAIGRKDEYDFEITAEDATNEPTMKQIN